MNTIDKIVLVISFIIGCYTTYLIT